MKTKRIFSVLLAVLMLVSTFSISTQVYAASLSKPTNVKVSLSTPTKVKVSWKKVKNAKKYYVYRASSKNGSYKKIGSTSKTYYYSSGLTKGKNYYFKVKAVRNSKKSKYSSSASIWGTRTVNYMTQYRVDADEMVYFTGINFGLNSTKNIDGYQFRCNIYEDDFSHTYTKSCKGSGTVFFYIYTASSPYNLQARPYKKAANGTRCFGPWKTVYNDLEAEAIIDSVDFLDNVSLDYHIYPDL